MSPRLQRPAGSSGGNASSRGSPSSGRYAAMAGADVAGSVDHTGFVNPTFRRLPLDSLQQD